MKKRWPWRGKCYGIVAAPRPPPRVGDPGKVIGSPLMTAPSLYPPGPAPIASSSRWARRWFRSSSIMEPGDGWSVRSAERSAMFSHWRDGEWGCRGKDCLDLEHPCRHQERWCPAIRRRARLLRKLARVSPKSLRARLLREQIRRAQQAMIVNLKRANRDLTKRVKRHGQRRRACPFGTATANRLAP
jgi:hypothetical protein